MLLIHSPRHTETVRGGCERRCQLEDTTPSKVGHYFYHLHSPFHRVIVDITGIWGALCPEAPS